MADDATHVDDHEHSSHDATFLKVFAILCFCTVASFAADFLPGLNVSDGVVAVVVLAIAVAKALCVMLFFMHLKWERNWKYVLLAPTVILSIGLPIALIPDVGVHYWIMQPTEASEAAGNHAADDAPGKH